MSNSSSWVSFRTPSQNRRRIPWGKPNRHRMVFLFELSDPPPMEKGHHFLVSGSNDGVAIGGHYISPFNMQMCGENLQIGRGTTVPATFSGICLSNGHAAPPHTKTQLPSVDLHWSKGKHLVEADLDFLPALFWGRGRVQCNYRQ